MRFNEKFNHILQTKNSLLCVGLDTDIHKIPKHLQSQEHPILKFNQAIVEATADFTAAYKVNFAFYEAHGTMGWEALKKTIEIIPDDTLIIADAKRGDIGNTSRMYAEAIFHTLGCHAATVNPYLGIDAIQPFIEDETHGVFILCLTSNPSAKDFQHLNVNGQPLYRYIAQTIDKWNTKNNCGMVVGATHPEELKEIRDLTPELPFLIPGVGAQGGDVESTVINGIDAHGLGAVINSSRGIIYTSDGTDFAEKAREAAKNLHDQINHSRAQKTR